MGSIACTTRNVYFAPTAKRSFMTLKAAANREAWAMINNRRILRGDVKDYGDEGVRRLQRRLARRIALALLRSQVGANWGATDSPKA